ncbi:MAG TPA: alpha/beta fold hydrolase [Byssovorax sp.]|jgi:pimeloyl-ACP methyl ester carboxylesterase
MPFATSSGASIHYETHGAASGDGGSAVAGRDEAPAVLVMGLGSDAHAWEQQLPALAAARPVVTLDNRGVGRSAKPDGPYTTAQMAADVVAVLDSARVEAAHVVGISLGGLVAQELALRHPGRVRSLALLATFARASAALDLAGRARPGGNAAANEATQRFAELLRALTAGGSDVGFMAVFSYLTKLVFSQAYVARERSYLQGFYARSLQYGLSMPGLAAQVGAVMTHDTEARLGEIRAPSLVVLGTADALVPPELSRDLAARIPGARLVEIEGGTHGLNFESADRVNKLLMEWFFANDKGESSLH